MSSESPKDTPEDRQPEPFARGRITWGRPPQTTFRVGPWPGAEGVSTAPRAAPGGGILTGSMIPPRPPVEPAAAAAQAPVAPPPVEPETAAPSPSLDPALEPVIEPVFEPVAAAPEPVFEPEPMAVQPEPEPAAAPREIVVEPEVAEPAVTVPPPLSGQAQPAARPRALPSVVVTPALYATVGAAVQKVTKGDRWTILAGVVAVAVIGGFIWLATLPAPQPVADAPTPLVAGAAPVEETGSVVDTAPPADTPVSAPRPAATAPTAAAPAVSTSAPITVAPRRPAPSAPIVVVPAEAAPRPYIETAPLAIDPPTPAAPAQQDPDAPIATRPQPLD